MAIEPKQCANDSREAPFPGAILCIGGFDPSGCAGLAADQQTLNFLGWHCITMPTLITFQGRRHLRQSRALSVSELRQVWQSMQDIPIAGIKIGAVADTAQAAFIADLLKPRSVPVVLDPILLSSSGGPLGQRDAIAQLAAHCDVLTPNREEAQRLFALDAQDPQWSDRCPAPLLVTGSDQASATGQAQIEHRLLRPDQASRRFLQPRLPGRYRGSGCRLASALCAFLSGGSDLELACEQALAQVARQLRQAWTFPDAIHIPQAR